MLGHSRYEVSGCGCPSRASDRLLTCIYPILAYPFTSPSQMLYRHFGVNRLALSVFDVGVGLMYTFGRS